MNVCLAHCLTLLLIYAASSCPNIEDQAQVLKLMKGITYEKVEKLETYLDMIGVLHIHSQTHVKRAPDHLACDLVKIWWEKNNKLSNEEGWSKLVTALSNAGHSEETRGNIHQETDKNTDQCSTYYLPDGEAKILSISLFMNCHVLYEQIE